MCVPSYRLSQRLYQRRTWNSEITEEESESEEATPGLHRPVVGKHQRKGYLQTLELISRSEKPVGQLAVPYPPWRLVILGRRQKDQVSQTLQDLRVYQTQDVWGGLSSTVGSLYRGIVRFPLLLGVDALDCVSAPLAKTEGKGDLGKVIETDRHQVHGRK